LMVSDSRPTILPPATQAGAGTLPAGGDVCPAVYYRQPAQWADGRMDGRVFPAWGAWLAAASLVGRYWLWRHGYQTATGAAYSFCTHRRRAMAYGHDDSF